MVTYHITNIQTSAVDVDKQSHNAYRPQYDKIHLEDCALGEGSGEKSRQNEFCLNCHQGTIKIIRTGIYKACSPIPLPPPAPTPPPPSPPAEKSRIINHVLPFTSVPTLIKYSYLCTVNSN